MSITQNPHTVYKSLQYIQCMHVVVNDTHIEPGWHFYVIHKRWEWPDLWNGKPNDQNEDYHTGNEQNEGTHMPVGESLKHTWRGQNEDSYKLLNVCFVLYHSLRTSDLVKLKHTYNLLNYAVLIPLLSRYSFLTNLLHVSLTLWHCVSHQLWQCLLLPQH